MKKANGKIVAILTAVLTAAGAFVTGMPVQAATANSAAAATAAAGTTASTVSNSEQISDYTALIQAMLLKQIEALGTTTDQESAAGTTTAVDAAAGTQTADAATGTDQTVTAAETDSTTTQYPAWAYSKLTKEKGAVYGPSGKETFYNLDMTGVVYIMHLLGYKGDYWVRSDGVKMFGDYIMCGADFSKHPRGSLIETSLGTAIVVDTGAFSLSDVEVDIATAW